MAVRAPFPLGNQSSAVRLACAGRREIKPLSAQARRRALLCGVLARCAVFLLFAFCILRLSAGTATQPLVWHQKEKTFDADLSGIELRELLKKISAITGWDVYLEPGTTYAASAKFRQLPRSDALRFLLGNLNFEISPQTNLVPKLFVFRTAAGKATQLIRAEKKPHILGKNKVILNHLIVTLKAGSSINIDALAQQLGGKIIGKLPGADSYLLEFPDEATASAARKQLSDNTAIASIDSNYSVDRPSPFKMAAVDGAMGGSQFALKSSAGGGDGKQIVVGLVDTAVQPLGANMQSFLLPALSVAGEATPGNGFPTHGTTMAESILFGLNNTSAQGQPTSVKILPVDIYGNNPETTTFDVANGIVQAVNGGANILSLSLGGEGDSSFLRALIEEVSKKAIPIFAAAGNQPVTTPVYPAAYPEVIAVTSAQDKNGTIAPYANRGDFVDIILPGATIVSFESQRYYVNGTSVSTALASGMMAGLADSNHQAPAKLISTMSSTFAFKR